MRLPLMPLVIAIALLGGGVYLVVALSPSRHTLDAPAIAELLDLPGTETEVSYSPSGTTLAVVADGDVWLVSLPVASPVRLTQTPEPEFALAWSPDGGKVCFSLVQDTWCHDLKSSTTDLAFPGIQWVAWIPDGRIAFVRDRGMWLSRADGQEARKLVEADSNAGIYYRSLQASPDGKSLAYVRSLADLHGEVWLLDLTTGLTELLVGDRNGEVPYGLAWILEGTEIVYLTNRSGGLSLWHINLRNRTILPLTGSLMAVSFDRLGLSTHGSRIAVPRLDIHSTIATSNGKTLIALEHPVTEPAASPDGQAIAFTVLKPEQAEVWTANRDGSNPAFRALGRSPRFAANGLSLVYSRGDLLGNGDIWQIDLRGGQPERLTDADELDITPDCSPDGRTIAFASARGGELALWAMPTTGGKRYRLNSSGLFPRFSPDSRQILYWNQQALWTASVDGGPATRVAVAMNAAPGVWTSAGPAYWQDGQIVGPRGKFPLPDIRIQPTIDIQSDGIFLISPVDYRRTGVISVDLVFTNNN